MPECPSCGFPVDPAVHNTCPKCDSAVRTSSALGLLEVDVVHAGESWEDASHKIEHAVDHALRWGHKGVKIIHGHGSTTGRAIIAPRAVALIKRLATTTGGRFAKDRQNPGASILWLNN